MAISFPNVPLPGTHQSPQGPNLQLATERTHFAGVNGETELLLGRVGGEIVIPLILHSTSFTSAQAVADHLRLLRLVRGEHGDLVITGNAPQTFRNVTFEVFIPDARGIMPDVGGTLNTTGSSSVTYWFCAGVARFYQLSSQGD